MPGTFTAMVPVVLAVLLGIMLVFSGISYNFYSNTGWTGTLSLIGLFVAFGLLVRSLRGMFGKYSGRMVFGAFMIAILGSYFGFLVHAPDTDNEGKVRYDASGNMLYRNKYPMG